MYNCSLHNWRSNVRDCPFCSASKPIIFTPDLDTPGEEGAAYLENDAPEMKVPALKLLEIEKLLREFYTTNTEGKGSLYGLRVLQSIVKHVADGQRAIYNETPASPSVREALEWHKLCNNAAKIINDKIVPLGMGTGYIPQQEIDEIVEYIRTALAVEQKWVSTDERLPMKSGDYLTYETNHGIKVISVMRFDDYNKSWYDDGDCFHPSHWQNLPFPPTPTNKT